MKVVAQTFTAETINSSLVKGGTIAELECMVSDTRGKKRKQHWSGKWPPGPLFVDYVFRYTYVSMQNFLANDACWQYKAILLVCPYTNS